MAVHDMHIDGMSMDGMNMDSMNNGDMSPDTASLDQSMDHMAISDMAVDGTTSVVAIPFATPGLGEGAVENRVDQPVESCEHCLGHSGIANAPVSFVNISSQSGKEIGPVLLPTFKSLIRPAVASAQIGLPREHAPPGSSAPRHILINVFLI